MTTRTLCRLAAAVILSAFPLTSEAGFGAWTTGGPRGGWVRSIVFDPKTPGVIYAATSGGVFVTRNGGQSWQRINNGLTVTNVAALDLDPNNPQHIGVAVDVLRSNSGIGGFFLSNNGGTSWQQSTTGMTPVALPSYVVGTSIAYDPLTSGVIYAGTYSGLFRTANGGNAWTGINNGLTSTFINSIAVDPMIPGRLYVGSDGLSATDNAGTSWYPSGNGMPATGVQDIAIDRLNPLTLYSAANFSSVNLYQSVDRAASWSPFNAGLPTNFGAIYHIAAEPSGLFVAMLGQGVYQYNSSPPTPMWYANNLGLSAPFNCASVTVDPFHPGNVWASDNGVLMNSNVIGLPWTPMNSGLTAHPINTVAIDPTNARTVYAGTQDRGFYMSSDAGATWSPINAGFNMSAVPPFVFSIVIDPTNPAVLYAGTGDNVYKSVNAGQMWTSSSSGLLQAFANYVYALAMDPSNPNVLYAGSGDGIYKSTNAATTWTLTTGTPNFSSGGFRSLAIDPQNPSIVYGGTGIGGVLKTVNGGASWTTITGNLPALREVAAIAIDPVDASNVYIGMEANVNVGKGGVFVTHNGGASWTSLPNGMTTLDVASLMFDPHNAATMLAGTRGGGVFISPNRGVNWFPLNSGAPNQFVSSLAMGTIAPFPILPFLKFRQLYAGTEGSVYNITY
jgi:photosystem II stability/assembly factor-like uncharacterized protein